MQERVHKQTLERAIDLWNGRDESYFELYSDDVRAHGFPPDVPPTLDGIRDLFHQMWASFPDMRLQVLRMAAERDLLAVHLRGSGTHAQEFRGAAPTEGQVAFEAMVFLRFDAAGKVVERCTRLDDLGLLRQLGAVPAPMDA